MNRRAAVAALVPVSGHRARPHRFRPLVLLVGLTSIAFLMVGSGCARAERSEVSVAVGRSPDAIADPLSPGRSVGEGGDTDPSERPRPVGSNMSDSRPGESAVGPQGASFGSLSEEEDIETVYESAPDFISVLAADGVTLAGYAAKADVYPMVAGRIGMSSDPIPVYAEDGTTQVGTFGDGGFIENGRERPVDPEDGVPAVGEP